MKRVLNNKKRIREIILCIFLLVLMAVLTLKANKLYIDPEKAFNEAVELEGWGKYELLLKANEPVDNKCRYYVGLLNLPKETEFFTKIDEYKELREKQITWSPAAFKEEGYLVIGELNKGLLWKVRDIRIEYYGVVPINAYYQQDMQMLLGLCLDPDITEVTMHWGHWIQQEDGNWTTYNMGKGIYPVDEKGFFYEEVDISNRMQYEDGSIETLVQTTYLEGRDKEGNVLYRDGIDDEGNRWIGDYDFGAKAVN